VDDNAAAGGNGTVSSKFNDLQTALDQAKEIQDKYNGAVVTIQVSGGTYRPTFAAGDYQLQNVSGYAMTVSGTGSSGATTVNCSSGYNCSFSVAKGKGSGISFGGTGASYQFYIFRHSDGSGGAYFRKQSGISWHRYKHFELRNNVTINGKYDGLTTYLDGSQNSVYSYHVVAQEGAWQSHTGSHIDSSAVLNGVTIQNGKADYVWPTTSTPTTTDYLFWSYSRGGAVFTYIPYAGRVCPTLTNVDTSGCISNSNSDDVGGVNDHKYCYSGTN
jgi:hypothetical protein